MGAHSTIRITRSQAIAAIREWAGRASDRDLGGVMDVILYDHLYNCSVLPDHCEDESEPLPLCVTHGGNEWT